MGSVGRVQLNTTIGTGPTYDDASADLDGQVPDGWQLLFVRAV